MTSTTRTSDRRHRAAKGAAMPLSPDERAQLLDTLADKAADAGAGAA